MDMVWVCVRMLCMCCERTCGVDGYPVDASVLCLELLQEDSHAVTERLEGELTALSPGRQTDGDHWQPVLIHHCHLCEGVCSREESVTQSSHMQKMESNVMRPDPNRGYEHFCALLPLNLIKRLVMTCCTMGKSCRIRYPDGVMSPYLFIFN